MKKKALDNLLFLLLGRNSHIDDLGTTSVSCQAAMVYLPLESNQSTRQIWWGGVTDSQQVTFLRKSEVVLGVFGRLQIETMLLQSIQHTKACVITYMTTLDDLIFVYEVLAIASIKEQQKCISSHTQKRSLIGLPCSPS
jgi:hypothetical protein